MLCKYPVVSSAGTFGCGQCITCRINQRRKWAGRICLEQKSSVSTMFVTLTYDDEHVPEKLSKEHIQKFLRSYRKKYGEARYYAAGEYGTKGTERPHYHILLFTREPVQTVDMDVRCSALWRRGFHLVRSGTDSAVAGYVAKYVTKKATKEVNEEKPEWHLSSRHPGIGALAAPNVCEELLKYGYFDRSNDVPGSITFNGKSYPVDRYIRDKMREYMLTEYGLICDDSVKRQAHREKWQELWVEFRHTYAEKFTDRYFDMRDDFSRFVADKNAGRILKVESRIARQVTQL